MIRGIAIMGLNGCGKSTLAHTIAKRLDFYEMDASGMYKNQNVSSLYGGFYESIAICNQTLNLLDKCVITDTVLWRQVRGEALALRAFFTGKLFRSSVLRSAGDESGNCVENKI